jgi:peptidoglycan hydrolase-like protein with peptidoglycan-binding domain
MVLFFSQTTTHAGYFSKEPVIGVVETQKVLNRLGYVCPIDGVNGNEITKAVIVFQQDHNLEVDGIVGVRTQR